MKDSDEQLVRRWQSGDDQAGALLAERYRQSVGAVAYAILGDMGLAEDVMQSTYEKASQRVDTLRDPRSVGAWLVVTARRTALDILRRRRRETPINDFDTAAAHDPGRDAEVNELGAAIRDAVAALPREQRELFTMKYVGGMVHRDIAAALGIRSDAVSQRLLRIRKQLRTQLEAHRP